MPADINFCFRPSEIPQVRPAGLLFLSPASFGYLARRACEAGLIFALALYQFPLASCFQSGVVVFSVLIHGTSVILSPLIL